MADKVLALENGRVTNKTVLGLGPNFSYNFIPSTESIEIPENQQMLVLDTIDIEGTLDIGGELCLISF